MHGDIPDRGLPDLEWQALTELTEVLLCIEHCRTRATHYGAAGDLPNIDPTKGYYQACTARIESPKYFVKVSFLTA
jgi:hypothetical protein